ncbi:MAG TPA: hypothetical protein VL099_01505 [Candidatus Binatia bacterium]|nr:hypothetical protein [Candidatus Binatia bacterium]
MISGLTATRRMGPDVSLPLILVGAISVLVVWMGLRVAYAQYQPLLVGAVLALDVCITYVWWRASVYILLVHIVVEGFLINAFASTELNLLKDAQIGLIVLRLSTSLIARRAFPIPRASWVVPYGLFALIYTAEIFNPLLPSIAVGLIGMRVTLLFSLAFVISYWFFSSRDQVMGFLRFHTWLTFPISAFGIVQYFTGPALLLSISPGFSRAIYYAFDPNDPTSYSYFRTISTFASTSGFSQYLWIAAMLTLALMLSSTRATDLAVCRVALLVQACALLTTGSRGPFVLLFVSIFVGFTLMGHLRLAISGAMILLVFFGASTLLLGSRVQNRFATILDFEMVKERNRDIGMGQIQEADKSSIAGYGAGRGCAATNRLYPDLVVGSENQFARIRYETGLGGLVLFCSAMLVLAVDTVRKPRLLRDSRLRVIGCLAASVPLVSMLTLPVGQPLDIPPMNFYFWFLIGLVQALMKIEYFEATAGTCGPAPAPHPA